MQTGLVLMADLSRECGRNTRVVYLAKHRLDVLSLIIGDLDAWLNPPYIFRVKPKPIALNSNNPCPWLWPLLLMAVVTLPILWLMPVLWAKSENLAVLVAFVALPGIALVGILASWMFRFPQMLVYELSNKALTIQTHYGSEKLERSTVSSARVLDYALRFSPKSKGHFPGYYVGAYDLPDSGKITAHVAQNKGQGVLLELKDGQKILLSPQNLDDLLRFFK